MGRPRPSKAAPESDAEAISEVWREVGGFIEDAMVRVGKSERLW